MSAIEVHVFCHVCQKPWSHGRSYASEPVEIPGALLHEGWLETHAIVDGDCAAVLVCSANCALLLEEKRRSQMGRMTEDEIHRLHKEC